MPLLYTWAYAIQIPTHGDLDWGHLCSCPHYVSHGYCGHGPPIVRELPVVEFLLLSAGLLSSNWALFYKANLLGWLLLLITRLDSWKRLEVHVLATGPAAGTNLHCSRIGHREVIRGHLGSTCMATFRTLAKARPIESTLGCVGFPFHFDFMKCLLLELHSTQPIQTCPPRPY